MLQNILVAGQIIGFTSLAAVIGLYFRFRSSLPEIIVEGTSDRTECFNSESKIIIKNNGSIAAQSIRADVHNLNLEINGNRFENCSLIDGGPKIASKLSGGESTEMTIRHGVGVGGGAHFDEYSYTLELHYHAKLLFFRKRFSKKWHVELTNYPDRFSWSVSIP